MLYPDGLNYSLGFQRRRQITSNVPESKFSLGRYENEVVQLVDIQYEYTLLSAQLDLAMRDSSIPPTTGKACC